MSLVFSVDDARGALLGDEILSTGSGSDPKHQKEQISNCFASIIIFFIPLALLNIKCTIFI